MEVIKGTYSFEYPSGEVEVLILKPDSTYIKKIYLDSKSYLSNEEAKLVNFGKWKIVKENELEFSNWLMYNNLRYPENILEEPYHTTMMDVHWHETSSKDKPTISVFYESGYVFYKSN